MNFFIKIYNVMKPTLEKISSRYKIIHEYLHHHVIGRKKIIFFSLLSIWLAVLVTGVISPKQQRYSKNQLETNQTFGNGTGEVNLVSQTFSKKNKIILLKFETVDKTSDIGSGINPNKLKWKLYVKNRTSKNMKMEVIPTVDNKIIVVVRNVDPGFQALAVDIKNKTVDISQEDPTLNVTDNNSSSSPSVKEKTDNNDLQFIVAENSDNLKNKRVKNLTREGFAIEAINKEITKQKQEKKRIDTLVSNLHQAIKDNNKSITDLESKSKYLTDSQETNNKQDIDSLKADNSQKEQQIETAQKSLKELDQRLNLLSKQKQDIKSGKFTFDDSIKTYDLK